MVLLSHLISREGMGLLSHLRCEGMGLLPLTVKKLLELSFS